MPGKPNQSVQSCSILPEPGGVARWGPQEAGNRESHNTVSNALIVHLHVPLQNTFYRSLLVPAANYINGLGRQLAHAFARAHANSGQGWPPEPWFPDTHE
jgi:hypothetical protein